MFLLGIAGKIGAGKSCVASILEQRGWRVLDLDAVSHEILESISETLAKEFGPTIINKKGRVNRKILGEIVFNNQKSLEKLEELTYSLIQKKTDEWLDSEQDRPAAVHAVNLHKMTLTQRFNAILWVHTPYFLRRFRVIKRENQPWKFLKGRFNSQKGLSPKLFCSHAETYIVRNSGNRRALVHCIDRIIKRLI